MWVQRFQVIREDGNLRLPHYILNEFDNFLILSTLLAEEVAKILDLHHSCRRQRKKELAEIEAPPNTEALELCK